MRLSSTRSNRLRSPPSRAHVGARLPACRVSRPAHPRVPSRRIDRLGADPVVDRPAHRGALLRGGFARRHDPAKARSRDSLGLCDRGEHAHPDVSPSRARGLQQTTAGTSPHRDLRANSVCADADDAGRHHDRARVGAGAPRSSRAAFVAPPTHRQAFPLCQPVSGPNPRLRRRQAAIHLCVLRARHGDDSRRYQLVPGGAQRQRRDRQHR